MPIDWQHNPPRVASLMPFWFWNDAIDAEAIRCSIADFDAHGVYGFVIHPRVGLPREIGWMSDAMLDLMRVAIDEADRRDMRVILYDEGMYPSGSSSGQVVARDPSLAARCLALHDLHHALPDGCKAIATFEHAMRQYAVIERIADSYIRGLHYVDESTATEDEPPAGDILNPRTAEMVIELVYDRFATRFGDRFGKTVLGIFTDEPNPLGKCREPNVWPGNADLLARWQRSVGADPAVAVAALWFDDVPDARASRESYRRFVRQRLGHSWYAPLRRWCDEHGLWLMGHPDAGDDLGAQRYFHVPGQDLVWRFVEPGKLSAIEGPESTQAACTASAKAHLGRPRNSNEFCGAYGHETTFDEVRWLARWCIVRGVDLLIPHAFYHSIRGPRRDERPPQLGPHTPSWSDGSFARFAAESQRLCALNIVGTPVVHIAILADGDRCTWRAAKVCLEDQRSFHYVTRDDLQRGEIRSRYRIVIEDVSDAGASDTPCDGDCGLYRYASDEQSLRDAIAQAVPRDVTLNPPSRDVRVRHVRVERDDLYMLFNEGNAPIHATLSTRSDGQADWIDPETGDAHDAGRSPMGLSLAPWQIAVLRVRPGATSSS